MAEIPIGVPPPGDEPLILIPGDPGQSIPRPTPLVGPVPPVKPLPPEAPTESPSEGNAGGVSDLTLIALLLVALALALFGKYLSDFLNWMLRTALGPFTGRRGAKQLDPTKVTQALSNASGRAVAGIDKQMGTEFTKLSQTTGRLSKTLIALGQMIYQLAGAVSGIEHHTTGLRQGQATIRAQVRQVEHTAATATAQIATVQKQADAETASLHGQLQALQHHVTHLIEPELEGLRSRIPKLEHGAVTTWDEVKKHEEMLGLAAMTGTVAVAMGRLGAGWTRCETNQAVGKALCGSNPDAMRRLLKGSLGLLGIIEVCSMLRLIAAAGRNPIITESLGVFASGIEDLLKCTGASLAPPLHTPQAALAPPSAWARLAPVTL